jgi:hypothetical protein
VRKVFERRFSASVMAENYLDTYSRLEGTTIGARLHRA